MRYSRRRFLRHLGASTAGIFAGRGLGPQAVRAFASMPNGASGSGIPLRLPSDFTGGDLIAARTSINIWSDAATELFTFGATFPGPTVRIRRGDELAVRLVNRLGEPTNIHWHGLLAPADMDGHPSDVIADGEALEYRFRVDQSAGTYWYHPHAHMATARQVYMGMAGFVIVEDPEEAALGLPAGERDVPLVLQDRRVDSSRAIAYAPSMMDDMTGYLGGTMLVNGTPDAYLEVSRDLYRFRLLNGSNARIYRLALDAGTTFHLVASDAGLLDRPYPLSELWLAPGERAEILVDFSGADIGTSMMLRSLQYDNALAPSFQGYPLDILRFDVTRAAAASTGIPSSLVSLSPPDVDSSTRTRMLRLAMQHGPGAMGHTINGRTYEMQRIDERVAAGSTEVWEIRNEDNDQPHPMHLHGAQFQVIERGGASPTSVSDIGWKDVVLVDPIETVKIAVRFGRHTGTFVAHCHNLEHEDGGMMMNFAVDASARAESGDGSKRSVGISIAPNPAVGEAVATVVLGVAGELVVTIYNEAGKRVRSLERAAESAGSFAVTIDVSDLAAGSYRVAAVVLDARAECPLIVAR